MKRLDVSQWPFARAGIYGSPFLWLLLFFVLPFFIVAKISLSDSQFAIPPYTAMFQWLGDRFTLEVSLANYLWLAEDITYLRAYGESIRIAAISTFLCMVIGFPMAYCIAKAPAHQQGTFLLLVLLPSWTSFLIRVYAWMGLLSNNGIINSALMNIGVISSPLPIMNTNLAVYIGVVYAYLPFMVLPLYANLVKHDDTLLEAASDLGARKWRIFLSVTLPLSKNGLIAGSMLVFIPVVGEYVIPELLGGRGTLMIGKVLWQEFFNNRDWPIASALALIMILVLIVPITLFHRVQQKELAGDQ